MKIYPIGAGQSADTESLTAGKPDVRKGKTAYIKGYDEPVVGTMPEYSGTNTNGNSSVYGDKIKVSPTVNGYYSTTSGLLIPKTAVANTGGLTADKLAYGETAFDLVGKYKGKGNAVQNQVLKGATFSTSNLSNGVGTIPVVPGKTITPSTVNQVAMYPSQYASSQTTVLGDPNLKPENIVENIPIFGVVGIAKTKPSGASDIYNRGKNPYGFYYTGNAFGSLQQSQIIVQVSGSGNRDRWTTSSNIDFTDYQVLRFEHNVTSEDAGASLFLIINGVEFFKVSRAGRLPHEINISNFQLKGAFTMWFQAYSPNTGYTGRWSGNIFRIWLEA